jgi:ribonucleoside-diphosphate reductase alpha chain/ribonucleoside-triphosphate reductase
MSKLKCIKRNNKIVDFDKNKIIMAIESAMNETESGIDSNIAIEIATIIENKFTNKDSITIRQIQDEVENLLMSKDTDAAKRYIIFRHNKDTGRKDRVLGVLLSEDFLSKYKHIIPPMNQLGLFVYYRTYSRWLPAEKRREYWWETVRRAVEYNCSLAPTSREEAEELFDNIYNLRQALSGRTFWAGGTDVSKKYPMSNFNCAFTILNSFSAFKDLFYLLMVGAGVGFRALKEDVMKLPKIRSNFKLIHSDYSSLDKELRLDHTTTEFISNDTVRIVVGDSKEGWAESLEQFFKIISSHYYRSVKTIIVVYDHVRPKGEKLLTFGGTASGHESLKTMFTKIDIIIKNIHDKSGEDRYNLKTIDCFDIANIIGENVVSGGVRRTAEIGLGEPDDTQILNAKTSLYTNINGVWDLNKDISHRQMSNNSIFYIHKPTREYLHTHIERVRFSGEPGFINAEAARKRRDDFDGVNPCGEILLASNGLCNLVTLNVLAFVENGELNLEKLIKAQRLSARAAYRMTCPELELHEWNIIQQRDKLIGCSLTGWQDMVNATGFDINDQIDILMKLRNIARETADVYAIKLGMNKPKLVTTVKPEGTLSLLPGVSSGVHYSHAPYFIRRIRISADDPLVKVCEELHYPVLPEVGQSWDSCKTKVIEFPCKAPSGKTKDDISAIQQLENYKIFMKYYVEHNCSITVHVRDDEWDIVEQWVWDNWDDIIGITFIPYNDSFYELLPFETITEDEYNNRINKMKPFIPSLISKYELEEIELDIGASSCENGVCPLR